MKKLPMRLCVGCQQPFPKKELVRIVKSPEGEFSIDTTGKKAGRGAYLCKSAECLAIAEKQKRLERSFKCVIDSKVYQDLKEEIENIHA